MTDQQPSEADCDRCGEDSETTVTCWMGHQHQQCHRCATWTASEASDD